MIQGFLHIKPKIQRLKFNFKDKLDVVLEDGREILLPLINFPDIINLTAAQRRKWQIIGGEGFTFDDINEVYHLEQILGKYENYKHKN